MGEEIREWKTQRHEVRTRPSTASAERAATAVAARGGAADGEDKRDEGGSKAAVAAMV